MNINNILNAMSDQGAEYRSRYHLTLGRLEELLSAAKPDSKVEIDGYGISDNVFCYRGYYSDLAIGYGDGVKVEDLLKSVRAALDGETFHGYKGGEYTMSKDTPLWLASNYGDCSDLAITDGYLTFGNVKLRVKRVRCY